MDDPRVLRMVVDGRSQAELCLRLDQGADRSLLVAADLEDQVSPGLQDPDGFLDQSCDHREPVGAAVESRPRLVVPHSRVETFDVLRGDVGRIGDDRIEWPLTGHRSELVAESKINAVRDTELGRIPPGDLKGFFADVNGHEPRPRLPVRRGDRQTSRACTDVDAAGRFELACQRQVFGNHELRFGARNQDCRGDDEGEREKLLASHEVGDRSAFGTAANQLAEAAAPKFDSPVMATSIRMFRSIVPGPDHGVILMIEYEDMAAYGARTAFENANPEWRRLFEPTRDSPETLVSVELLTEITPEAAEVAPDARVTFGFRPA